MAPGATSFALISTTPDSTLTISVVAPPALLNKSTSIHLAVRDVFLDPIPFDALRCSSAAPNTYRATAQAPRFRKATDEEVVVMAYLKKGDKVLASGLVGTYLQSE